MQMLPCRFLSFKILSRKRLVCKLQIYPEPQMLLMPQIGHRNLKNYLNFYIKIKNMYVLYFFWGDNLHF